MVLQRVWSLVLHLINEEPGARTSSKAHSWTGGINCVRPSTFLLAQWQPGRQGWKLKSYQDSPEMRSEPPTWISGSLQDWLGYPHGLAWSTARVRRQNQVINRPRLIKSKKWGRQRESRYEALGCLLGQEAEVQKVDFLPLQESVKWSSSS